MKKFLRLFVLLSVSCLLALPVRADNPAAPVAKHEPNVEIWVPPDFQSGKGPWPLIIYSHAFGGCAKQSAPVMSYLADQGYIVAAPDHADGIPCGKAAQAAPRGLDPLPEKPFRNPEQWSDQTYKARRDDILFTLTSILADPRYKGLVDEDHVGLMGHSLGGYTALGLAGGWPSWKDRRFKAVIAFSAYANPYILHRALGNIDIPVMYQGGTRDDKNTPAMKQIGWKQARAPKYFIELQGADHYAWVDLEERNRGLIESTTLAFFDKYLKGGTGAVLPDKNTKGVATVWQDEGMVKAP